jgi:hypothetical protein
VCLTPISAQFRELSDGLPVIIRRTAVRNSLLLLLILGQQRPNELKTCDKTYPYLAYTRRYTDNTEFADQMIAMRILLC